MPCYTAIFKEALGNERIETRDIGMDNTGLMAPRGPQRTRTASDGGGRPYTLKLIRETTRKGPVFPYVEYDRPPFHQPVGNEVA